MDSSDLPPELDSWLDTLQKDHPEARCHTENILIVPGFWHRSPWLYVSSMLCWRAEVLICLCRLMARVLYLSCEKPLATRRPHDSDYRQPPMLAQLVVGMDVVEESCEAVDHYDALGI